MLKKQRSQRNERNNLKRGRTVSENIDRWARIAESRIGAQHPKPFDRQLFLAQMAADLPGYPAELVADKFKAVDSAHARSEATGEAAIPAGALSPPRTGGGMFNHQPNPPPDPRYQQISPQSESSMICEWCGERFEWSSAKRRFCSDRCRYAARDRKPRVERGTRVDASCRRCGSDFAYKSTTKPRAYCLVCSPVWGERFGVPNPG